MGDRWIRRAIWFLSIFFVVSLFGFAVQRISVDSGNIGAPDSLPATDFNRRYAEHPIIAYLHIVPGVIYIALAPFQLARTLRRRSLATHRLVGRVAVAAGLTSAVFGILFGVFYPWGGFAERSASLCFGLYMAVALWLGLGQARRRSPGSHRRWMIRAFAVSLGVATIRVILSVGEALDLYEFDDVFGIAFWAGLTINAVAAEAWLHRWPTPSASPRKPSPVAA